MPTVWRITTTRFADSAFSGEGARLFGGRWNQKGLPLVYTAGSQALAVLEMLVQDEPLRAPYLMIPARIPDDLRIERIGVEQLLKNWREFAARERLQALGAAWVEAGESAVLRVPSAVIPAEPNFLLNPLHADFARIEIGGPQEHVTDLRLPGRRPV